ncbi:MMPL family transporter [Geobacter pickeringii]|uniref:RND transporter n=1 Tax=Geobacter pickeringii TaxID=345632 RepID=A0A0B5BJA2_9BACT|nr:MMPL family transporter [Geobacter pickeringii]AJE04575.1 RND transporter [Geobacter pickeringii]
MTTTAARLIAAIQAAIRGHLEWIFRLTWRHPGATIAGSLLVLILSLASVLTVRFESDIFKLFPTDNGALRLFLDTLDWTGSAGEAYFILEGERERLPAAADRLAGRLRELQVDGAPAFRKVSYRVVDPAETAPFAAFVAYAVDRPQLFLDPGQADAFAARLTPQAMDRALRRATAELASGAGMGVRDLVAADPLYLRELILPRLQEGSRSLDLDPESPYFLSRDGRLLVMIAEPARPVKEMGFARKLVAGINAARAGIDPRVSVSCAGAHLSAVIDEAVMKHNIIACITSSLFVVLGLFYLTYRRLLPTLLIPVIIVFGTLLALGTAGLILPSIHIISFAFTALIIGLGTDYSIHLYDRFASERLGGRGIEEALRLAVVDTGHGVFTAAATTAFPFLALGIAEVRALSELGLLVGLGVLFSMYATFFFLPPLLHFAEKRFPRPAAPLPSFGLSWIWRSTGRHPRAVSLAAVALTAAFFAASFFLDFEGELKNLQPRHSEAFLTQERIERHLSLAPKQMVVAVEGKSVEEVMTRGRRVGELAERYRQRHELAAVSWLGQVINDRNGQAESLERLKERLGDTSPATALRGALVQEGFDPTLFSDTLAGVARLPGAGPVPAAEAVERLRSSPLRGMVERYLIARNGTVHLLLYLHYRGSEFPQETFLRDLRAVDPTARATSPDLISRQLGDSVRTSFIEGFAVGGAIILFLLLVHFESLAGIAAAILPVTAGVAVMTGLMVVTGMRLNFMNAMVLVTILGMGSDYGLHIYHRLAGAPVAEGPARFTQAGRAVLLSALTTIAGFGSLAFTDYGAMASIGWATNYGVGATALFSLVALPAAMALTRRHIR